MIAVVVAGLWWLLLIGLGFGSDARSAGLGLAALLLGWIPALLFVILCRLSLEFSVATIKTAENTSVLANRR